MLEEQQEQQEQKPSRCDLPVDSHTPASAKSQDISHVLASTFKELYTKVTPCNLMKAKGRSSYHDKYVEELKRVRAEYNQRIKEADMLESHIIQARARAAATERRTAERMKEDFRDVPDLQGLPPVKSAFIWHVDEGLLQVNNLISPLDYLKSQKMQMKAPAVVKPDLTRPTMAYTMHTATEAHDNALWRMRNESESSQTMECSSLALKNKKTPDEMQNRPKPKWKDEPSATDRADGNEKLQKMKERQRILQNPRFLPPKAQQGATSLIRPRSAKNDHGRDSTEAAERPKDNPVQVFVANPPVVLFTVYSVGQVYETTLELQNVTFSSRDIRVLPPNSSYFTIGLGRFPGKGGVVAPGMSCKFMVRFAPDSLADYEDCIVVESQAEHILVVPIKARRPPPVLTLPSVLDCGYCLIGGVRCVEFYCQNVGLSAGTFCIVPKNQWPATNPRLVVTNSYSDQPPFAVSPSFFALQPGETTVVEAVFFPTTTKRICQLFTVVCDNCQVKDICVQGEGQLIALELLSVSGKEQPPTLGEVHDMTADHFVRFDPCNPHAVQQKAVVIRNNVHLELPFHWQVMKPNLLLLPPGEIPKPCNIQYHHDRDDIFQVSPATGILAPCQDREFTIAFCPKEMQDYHSVCHLVLSDVPQLPLESCDEGSGLLQPVRIGSQVGDATVMEIEVKGTTEPFNILLEPYALIIPGELFIFTTTQRHFKMWNHSKTPVFFRWDTVSSSCHQIEVEPATGKIDEKECFVFKLIVTGGKPEKVVTSLLCHIEHRSEPVTLAVEVTFKGPSVSISAPSVDFGLMRLGEQSQKTLYLDNVTHLEASWTLEEVHKSQDDGQDPQLIMEPCSGVLPPLTGCSVVIHFRPQFCQELETELELSVENGTGCHLLLGADVQSPQLCLLNCKLLLSELYMGVAAEGTVTLFNQTLLPSNFSWMDALKGQQASLCSATFEPPSGTLGPNARLDITVSFISQTDSALNDVVALCEVEGMSSPLVLSIQAPTTQRLRVSYSLPGINSPPPDNTGQSELTVDFGDMLLGKPITKQLLMTNHTAIPAPFTIHAEYFNSDASKPSSQSKRRFQYMKKPLHSVQARKLEEQSHKDFLSNLLANGKGTAFFIVPSAGTLDPFETQTVDVTAYSDMWGEYRDNLVCKVGDLEPSLLPMQMTVKGCPLYFQITGPRPDDQHQGPNVQFGTRLSGGDTITRSLRINNPTLFDIRLDWETYNVVPNDRKLVDIVMSYGESFPLKDANGNPRGASTLSNGEAAWKRPQGLGSEASLHSSNAMEREDCTTKDDNNRLCPAKRKMLSVHIRPHVGDKSNEPYCVTPQQIVIPAQGSSTVHVSFTPLALSATSCESKCMGLALGFISLDSEVAVCVLGKVARVQGLDLEPIRVELLAVVKPAVLLVQMEDDNKVVEFHTSAGDLLRIEEDKVYLEEFDNVQSFLLKNTTEMPLRFRLRTQPPFSVLKVPPRAGSSASSRSSAADPHALILHSQNSILVRVAFCCSPSLLEYTEHPTDGVTLVPSDSGYKQLRIHQDLLIHYSNNSLQMVPLYAHLKLTSLCLSTDHINFGLCYLGQTQAKEVKLYSLGSQTHWSLHIESTEDNSHVFSVTPSFGLLRSKDHQSTGDHCQRLEISFTASEVKHYKSTVVITSILERSPLLLQLQGTGSRQMYL
ncbi:deleted in lung and esophageal cancer protein 1 isoform X1 [Phycodurus eques]|uniref:deleted in lung and esophageal cancer protein 1 isoform X1 n=1 Tax=Phycodurus eques TaxID=693459 RepID=UPI002ACD65A1|nr:deleted in lung and esophageal cancer protein 1 isoform X1 [Phycodurus eques]XP_061522303.1 deleted in lung and esophageal cancer protein 1 isoform X1 [Phycodurus eques]